MNIEIVVHTMPHELDWFEWQVKQLKIGSTYISNEDSVTVNVTLNLNGIDWNATEIPKQFFIDKFRYIESLCDWAIPDFTVDDTGVCTGVNIKRTQATDTSTSDTTIWLDADIVFRPETLGIMIEASKAVNNKYYAVSPQIQKLWDNTWDCLVAKHCVEDKPGQQYIETDPYGFVNQEHKQDLVISPLQEFKLGAGWFNIYSTNLLKAVGIPKSFGNYGEDDTYLMYCSDAMRAQGYDVMQYVVEGLFIAENFKYRTSPLGKYITRTATKDQEVSQAKQNLVREVELFRKNLKNNTENTYKA